MLRLLAATAVVLTFALASTAEAGELVVIDSANAPFAIGDTVAADTSLSLPAGARLSLVSEDGAMVELRGPFEGVPEVAGGERQSVGGALASMVEARAANTASLGAVRSGTSAGALPEAWLVDATTTGPACVRPGAPVTLWRAAASAESELTLSPADRSWSAGAPWPAGEQSLELPADVPFADGETFLVTVDGVEAALTIHVLPESLTNEAMQGAFLAAKGCERQLAALARTTR